MSGAPAITCTVCQGGPPDTQLSLCLQPRFWTSYPVCDPPLQCGPAEQPRSALCSRGGDDCLHAGPSAACLQASGIADPASSGTAAWCGAALSHGLEMSAAAAAAACRSLTNKLRGAAFQGCGHRI
eukprot:859562-Pelagomonas_calceolata.AAC.3